MLLAEPHASVQAWHRASSKFSLAMLRDYYSDPLRVWLWPDD